MLPEREDRAAMLTRLRQLLPTYAPSSFVAGRASLNGRSLHQRSRPLWHELPVMCRSWAPRRVPPETTVEPTTRKALMSEFDYPAS